MTELLSQIGYFDADAGHWVQIGRPRFDHPRPALFLDRDGVIVEEKHYLRRADDVSTIDGASEVIRLANRMDIPVVVVTNQAGIGRGFYDWPEFEEVDEAIRNSLASRGAMIDAVFACPFHEDALESWRHPAHPSRKPRPGMLHAAADLLNLDLGASWIVGDHSTDILAGYSAGLRGALHVLTGRGLEDRASVAALRLNNFDLRFGDSIRQAEALLNSES